MTTLPWNCPLDLMSGRMPSATDLTRNGIISLNISWTPRPFTRSNEDWTSCGKTKRSDQRRADVRGRRGLPIRRGPIYGHSIKFSVADGTPCLAEPLVLYRLMVALSLMKTFQCNEALAEIRERYFLYTRTRIGYFYHRREIAKAREKYSDGHSVPTITEFDGLSILPVAMMEDNYAYLIIDTKTQKTVVVDPGDPQPVKTAIERRHLSPVAVLTTHKHWDHSGGNSEMRQLYPGIQVYGGAMDHVPAITHPVADGDVLEFGPMKFTAKFTPGHTVGHVVYVLDGLAFGAPDSLFSGDHLFLSGCGRMFECSAGTMLRSFDSLQSLPDTTLVWPGHEYAIDNLEFTIHIDPDNEAAQAKQKWSKSQRSNKLCTCPSTMGEEKQYNPFLRTNSDSLLQSLGMIQSEDADRDHIRSRALAEIRERKDNFKYKL